ncbi:MAG: hypothetical protein ACM3Q2_03345 [Syntrophothermus sp.]
MRYLLFTCILAVKLSSVTPAQNEAFIDQVGTAKTCIYQAVIGSSEKGGTPGGIPETNGAADGYTYLSSLPGLYQNKIMLSQISQSHNYAKISQSGANTSLINMVSKAGNEINVRQNGYDNFLLMTGRSAGSSELDITQNGNGNNARITNETLGNNSIYLTQNNGSNNADIKQNISGPSGSLHILQEGNKSLIVEQTRRIYIEKPMTIYIEQK